MTEELRALAGQSEDLLSNLTWRDLIEFYEEFKVGVENLSELDPAQQIRATAWLIWKAHRRKTKSDISFEEFLDTPIPQDFFQVA